jgi:hypothetical protein
LSRRTAEIVERDNRQALSLGLSPVKLIAVDIFDGYKLWIGLQMEQNGVLFRYYETSFYYACRGVPLGDNSVVDYFEQLINRPDGSLGGLDRWGKEPFSKILLGYLHK